MRCHRVASRSTLGPLALGHFMDSCMTVSGDPAASRCCEIPQNSQVPFWGPDGQAPIQPQNINREEARELPVHHGGVFSGLQTFLSSPIALRAHRNTKVTASLYRSTPLVVDRVGTVLGASPANPPPSKFSLYELFVALSPGGGVRR
jgi:hypothetical protein